MKWADLKPGMFVRVWFLDHWLRIHDDVEEGVHYHERDITMDLDEKSPPLHEVRGQVLRINRVEVVIEGAWISPLSMELGEFGILHRTVSRIAPLPAGHPLVE